MACNSIGVNDKFDKSKWITKDDKDYSMRKSILNDLVSHHQLKGLTYKQLIDSLGEPSTMGMIRIASIMILL